MSMKRVTSFFCALLLACSAAAAAACTDVPLKEVEAEIWTMPSTVKVLRDESYEEYYTDSPVLEVKLAKNESEGVQLIVTPEEDVSYYDVSVGSLTNAEGAALGKADVYAEYYVPVTKMTNPNSVRPKGYYPDALIPMELSVESGENVIGAGQNQGIYICLTTKESTPAGEYRGTVTLTINEKEHLIPIVATVWDFVVPVENHARSTFNLMQEYMMGGQLDNTTETYQNTVDFLLDYRITTTEMASWDYNLDDWIEVIKRYAADPRVTSYNVHGDGTVGMTRLKACIENSTPELNLVDKAFFYLHDEPFTMMEQAKINHDNKIDELIALANSYSEEELAGYGLTREDIMRVEVLITMTASIDTIDGLRTYAALASDFDTQSMRDMYEEFRRNPYLGKNNELAGTDFGTTWWYVCVHPYEPYVNFNIEMDLHSNRELLWMQYDYDIEGLLYWGTAMYVETTSSIDTINGAVTGDVYHKTNGVYTGANGDGYLVYPGAKYGQDGVLPSIRLMSIRDGFEDYEYLYLLENLYNEKAEEYGVTDMEFDAMMRSVYDSMYTGTIANDDFEAVLRAREKIAQMIELLSSEVGAVYSVGEVDALSKSVDITVVAKKGSVLKVGEETISGTDYGNATKIVYTMSLGEEANHFSGTIVNGDSEVTLAFFVTNGVVGVTNFEEEEEIGLVGVSQRLGTPKDHITASYNAAPAYVKSGAGSLKLQVAAQEWTMAELARYRPYFYFERSAFGDVKKIRTFEMDVFNPGTETLAFSAELSALSESGAVRNKRLLETELAPGWNKIKIDNFASGEWTLNGEELYSKVVSVNFYFDLLETDITVYVDNVYCTGR